MDVVQLDEGVAWSLGWSELVMIVGTKMEWRVGVRNIQVAWRRPNPHQGQAFAAGLGGRHPSLGDRNHHQSHPHKYPSLYHRLGWLRETTLRCSVLVGVEEVRLLSWWLL